MSSEALPQGARRLVNALGSVLRTLVGKDHVSCHGDKPNAPFRVFSYAVDFARLWGLNESTDLPLCVKPVHGDVTVVLVWDWTPTRGTSFSKQRYLTPIDWAVGLSLLITSTVDKITGTVDNKMFPGLRFFILDLVSDSLEAESVQFFAKLEKDALGSMPWIRLVQVTNSVQHDWNLAKLLWNAFVLSTTQGTGATGTVGAIPSLREAAKQAELENVGRYWAAGLAQPGKEGNGHAQHKWRWWLMRLAAAEQMLRIESTDYRHRHGNVLAAMRLYLGALSGGVTNGMPPKTILEAFARQANRPDLDPRELLARIEQFRHMIKALGGIPDRNRLLGAVEWERRRDRWDDVYSLSHPGKHDNLIPFRECRTAMLDDQLVEAGWQDFLEACFDETDGWTSWEQAKQHFQSNPQKLEKLDLLLLDCDLNRNSQGQANASGLELLAPLRELSQDLPIVMMTAHDDAELALWALRAGCNFFYSKQLRDEADRDSLDYFLHFAEVVRRPKWLRDLRELWCDFQRNLPIKGDASQDVERSLRLAFYLMFSLADESHWWVRTLTAIGEQAESVEQRLCRMSALAIETAMVAASIDEKNHLSGRACGVLQNARHPTGKAPDPTDICHQKGLLGEVLNRLTRAASATTAATALPCEPLMPAGCGYNRDDLVESTTGAKPLRQELEHQQRSVLGAAQLIGGYVLQTPGYKLDDALVEQCHLDPASAIGTVKARYSHLFQKSSWSKRRELFNAEIILIDDEGQANGWKEAIQDITGASVHWYASCAEFLQKRENLKRSGDVVLLDLYLKPRDPRPGIEAVESLKEVDPGLPIIVISARSDALDALRCMRRGALDYFPRWIEDWNNPERLRDFTTSFHGKLCAAIQLGKSDIRDIWRIYQAANAASSPLDRCPPELFDLKGFQHRINGTEIRRKALQILFPAVVRYYSACIMDIGSRPSAAMPPLDFWRIERILQSKTPHDEVILIAGQTVEYLGWMRLCLDERRKVSPKKVQQYQVIRRAAPNFGSPVWNDRNSVLRRSNKGRPHGTAPDAALRKALRAIEEFERRIANDCSRIIQGEFSS